MEPPLAAESLILLGRAREGDKDAENELFKRYYPRVRKIVAIRIGPALRAKLDLDDVVQDAFLVATRALPRLEITENASILHWFSVMIENRIRNLADYHQSRKRDQNREMQILTGADSSMAGGTAQEPMDTTTLPPEKIAKIEMTRMLEDCISNLSEEHRDVILLRDYAGASWKVVAEEMHKSTEDAARMLHSRAKVELLALVKARKTAP